MAKVKDFMPSKYTIIEDCSPYYIRFTHDGIDKFIDYANKIYNEHDWSHVKSKFNPNFRHCRLPVDIATQILNNTPIADNILLKQTRVSYFHSAPGLKYTAHKDGIDHRFSINYTLKVLDDKCITSWYTDEELSEYHLEISEMSRELNEFDSSKHQPIKTMIAQTHECILFNTEIYHAWDNSQSTNERLVLTLRAADTANIYYDDAKKILFGIDT